MRGQFRVMTVMVVEIYLVKIANSPAPTSVIIVGGRAAIIVSIVRMGHGIVRSVTKGNMNVVSVMVIGNNIIVSIVLVQENGMKKIQKHLLG